MAKISDKTIARWSVMAADWVSAHGRGIGLEAIDTGQLAWSVAHSCGITNEAYQDRTILDAHIQTALEKIFPNAVFKDAKRY